MLGRRLRALTPAEVLVLGFALFLVYAFPGYMSTDSVQQLSEARSGVFSDGNPPLMAAEWWLLDRIISGPILMLLLQGTLFLGGLYVLFQRVLSRRGAAWAAIGVLLFPPVLSVISVIWKDSQMAAYLVAGTAAMLQPRLRTRLVGLALVAAGTSMRHNAIAAALPLVAILFEWRPGLRVWKRIAIVAVVAVVTAGAAFAVTRVLAKQHVRLTPVFYDIVAVVACTDDRSDADLREVLRGTPLAVTDAFQPTARLLHSMHGSWRIVGSEERLFDTPTTEAQWDALGSAWRRLVFGDPWAYLQCHGEDFARILGATDEQLRAPVWNLFLEDWHQMLGTDHNASWSWAQEMIGMHGFYWLADDTPLFRPWIYAVIAIVLLVLCCRDRVTLALLTSGLLYELSFFPVGAEPDYRYSHWMITTVVISCVMLFVLRRRARRA